MNVTLYAVEADRQENGSVDVLYRSLPVDDEEADAIVNTVHDVDDEADWHDDDVVVLCLNTGEHIMRRGVTYAVSEN